MSPLSLAVLMLALIAKVHLADATEPTCPTGTDRIDAAVNDQWWCVRHYGYTKTFCEAVKICHTNGEEMISKPVYNAMKANSKFSGNPFWWVGLVDAANERVKDENGWVWIKDGQVTTGTDNPFASGEPNDNTKQDCVTTKNEKKDLRDEECTDPRQFYCYSDPSAKADPPKTRKFEKVEIREYNQIDDGCWIRESNASTVISCTLACFAFEFDDCVGFYWNPMNNVCVILPYFDANLPLALQDLSASYMEQISWIKYRRTSQ